MDVDVYCDESRQDLLTSRKPTSRYFLVGGLWVARDRRAEFNATIRALRREHNVHGEFKWHKVSPSRQNFYESLIDLFIRADQDMRFRCVVVDRTQLDMSYHDNDPELGYYKFYYQLVHHWIEPANAYAVYCDHRSNRLRTRHATLQKVLQRANRSATIERVQSLESHQVGLLQLNDLLLGAASTRVNDRTLSPSKETVIQRLERGLHLNGRIAGTWRSESKYNVFRIQLRRS